MLRSYGLEKRNLRSRFIYSADGVDTGKELTLSEANAWTASFANLRKYKGADEIKYTVKEERVSGYSTQ